MGFELLTDENVLTDILEVKRDRSQSVTVIICFHAYIVPYLASGNLFKLASVLVLP